MTLPADPRAFRLQVVQFDPRRGPYDIRRHPLWPFRLYLVTTHRIHPSTAAEYTALLRQVITEVAIPVILDAKDPDDAIPAGVVRGWDRGNDNSRRSRRSKFRHVVRLFQQWCDEGCP